MLKSAHPLTGKVSFIRNYTSYTGGHQKVRDYMQHFIDLGWHTSFYKRGTSQTEPRLFSCISGVNYQAQYQPEDADLVFLAGMDWQDYLALGIKNKNIINLIQHVRHADPAQPLFEFLSQPAIRICVSESVRQAILPHANGPVHTIPMGHRISKKPEKRTNDIYILANKQPELGNKLADYFLSHQYSVICHNKYVQKHEVLNAMASSHISITLPHITEGFYLPGIEAMALSDIAIVPDCVASVEYTKGFNNAMRCILDYHSIIDAHSLAKKNIQSPVKLALLKYIGMKTVKSHSLEKERFTLNKLLLSDTFKSFKQNRC